MNVVVVNPPSPAGVAYVREGKCEQRASSYQYLMVPISVLYVASVLRDAGHEVAVIDCVAGGKSAEQLAEEVSAFGARLAVINVSTPTLASDMEASLRLRESCGCHTSAFGVHVTALPREALITGAWDSVMRGEPEYTARALADTLEAGRELSSVAGLSYSDEEGGVHDNPDRPFADDLDAMPFPARDLIDNSRYTAPMSLSRAPQTAIVTARGCPFSCTFCTARCYWGSKPRYRGVDSIADEIQECVTRFNITSFIFWADTFTLNREQVMGLCDEIVRRGLRIEWICNSRVDTVDLEMLRHMKAAGCGHISFGMESGSQQILDAVKKGTTVDQARDVMAWAREAGIKTLVYVVLGLPGETKGTILETKRLIREIDPDYVQYHLAVPFPGTTLREEALHNDLDVEDDWSLYEINRPGMRSEALTRQQLQREKSRAFYGFYLRPRVVLREIRALRSVRQWGEFAGFAWSFARDWVRPRR